MLFESFISAFVRLKANNLDRKIRVDSSQLIISNQIIEALFSETESCNEQIKIFDGNYTFIVKDKFLSQCLILLYLLLCEKYGVWSSYNYNFVMLNDKKLLEQWNLISLKRILILIQDQKQIKLLGNEFISKFTGLVMDLRPQYFSDLTSVRNFSFKTSSLEFYKNDEFKNYFQFECEIEQKYKNLVFAYSEIMQNSHVCDYFLDFLSVYVKCFQSNHSETFYFISNVTEIFKNIMIIYPELYYFFLFLLFLRFVFRVLNIISSNFDKISIIKMPPLIFNHLIDIFS